MKNVTNHQLGHDAEKFAVEFLKKEHFKILAVNWRTRVCEIDIVANKKNTTYFIEVKYRSTNNQGKGLDYITAKKLEQMRFAAKCWVNEHSYNGLYDLGAIEISADYEVTQFIESID